MSYLLSVAPMMDYTDRHARYFLRLIAPDVRLYTEMITAQALLHGDRARLLAFDVAEKPLALQLGGHQPALLADCARIGEDAGYDEINLNVGCPSDRVRSGRFGACLMLEPQLVAECVAAMQASVQVPVTVKCRIGVDHEDSYEALQRFVHTIAAVGCKHFIVHARKAWLSGLSPKQNREIPPLRYEVVHQLKKDNPKLIVILNGGIKTVGDIKAQLPFVDGVMLGRAAYFTPYILAEAQRHFFHHKDILSKSAVVEAFLPYVHNQLQNGVKLSSMTRHILGLFQSQRGAAAWRRYLSQHAYKSGAGIEVIKNALALVE